MVKKYGIRRLQIWRRFHGIKAIRWLLLLWAEVPLLTLWKLRRLKDFKSAFLARVFVSNVWKPYRSLPATWKRTESVIEVMYVYSRSSERVLLCKYRFTEATLSVQQPSLKYSIYVTCGVFNCACTLFLSVQLYFCLHYFDVCLIKKCASDPCACYLRCVQF